MLKNELGGRKVKRQQDTSDNIFNFSDPKNIFKKFEHKYQLDIFFSTAYFICFHFRVSDISRYILKNGVFRSFFF